MTPERHREPGRWRNPPAFFMPPPTKKPDPLSTARFASCLRRRSQQIMLLDNRRGISRLIGNPGHDFVDGNERRNASMPQRVPLPLDASVLGDLLLEPVKKTMAARPDRLMRPDVWIQPPGQRLVDRDSPPAVRFGDPREWLPGERDVAAVVQIPASLERGDYTLAVALIDPASPERTLNLAMDAPAKDGWYLVSQARVE